MVKRLGSVSFAHLTSVSFWEAAAALHRICCLLIVLWYLLSVCLSGTLKFDLRCNKLAGLALTSPLINIYHSVDAWIPFFSTISAYFQPNPSLYHYHELLIGLQDHAAPVPHTCKPRSKHGFNWQQLPVSSADASQWEWKQFLSTSRLVLCHLSTRFFV